MEHVTIRKPAVAGQFYPGTAAGITKQLESFLSDTVKPRPCIGMILPHAGYMYSGMVAAETAAYAVIPKTVILLGPNHTGMGVPFSIMAEGVWQTPMGQAAVNQKLARQFIDVSGYLQEDTLAHLREHSLEVVVPILQYFRKDFSIVPIVLGSDNFEALTSIGKSMAAVIRDEGIGSEVLIVASSDMTHYESADSAKLKDYKAIEAIEALDEKKLYSVVRGFDITMCGYMPVIALLSAANALGASKAEVIRYSNSGVVTGDDSSVVGYAGMIIS
jgi:hypothetical protein